MTDPHAQSVDHGSSHARHLQPLQHQQQHTHTPPRPARSKEGCMTCRRRKVRCDEQRPRCSHCTRLNLECRWRPRCGAPNQWRFIVGEPGALPGSRAPARRLPLASSPDGEGVQSPSSELQHHHHHHHHQNQTQSQNLQQHEPLDPFFDYGSFLWEASGEVMGYAGIDQSQMNLGFEGGWVDPWPSVANHSASTLNGSANKAVAPLRPRDALNSHTPQEPTAPATRPSRPAIAADAAQLVDDQDLISYFIRTIVPPILAEIETQKRWSSVRHMLISMSNNSAMVRCAILAFSSLLYYRKEAPNTPCPQHYYETALDELAVAGNTTVIVSNPELRQNLLATSFFLSYVDILEDRVAKAHEHHKRAYQIFKQANKRGFRHLEIRLLSWIRLLDARTVSAGGEGLFLSDSSEILIVHPSPASVDDTEEMSERSVEEIKEWDIEDSLFQVLHSPGVVFFQKVQSFMGRISMIDPWHRSRGTVEDEVEVTNIASGIMKDLRGLYDERPALMDYAVEGRLEPPHISPNLAAPISRAFRTYLSNYYASKIHLHRVAFKHLPLSRETAEAVEQIRRLTKLLVDGLEPDGALPVSQLWPLLMMGSEEKDATERAWIKDQILRMVKVATNARITAHVLEEVQTRQDASKCRVDIRSVMHDIFDSCFAIM